MKDGKVTENVTLKHKHFWEPGGVHQRRWYQPVLFRWWRHWQLETEAFGTHWCVGLNWRPRMRRGIFRRQLKKRWHLTIVAYTSPDATPQHPKARGIGKPRYD